MSLKQYTREEVKNGGGGGGENTATSTKNRTRFIIHDRVYDVTEFLNEHPGGEEVLLDHAGSDASEDFDDVGHSADAFALMERYLVGEIVESERKNTKPRQGWVAGSGDPNNPEKYVKGPGMPLLLLGGAIIALLLALLYFQ